jgi:GT2 family glycosyltransferase
VEDTIECLESLVASNTVPDTIIVVDNGSKDDSANRLAMWALSHFSRRAVLLLKAGSTSIVEYDPSVKFALNCNDQNDGFGAGANLAIELANRINRFDFLWFLNSDTIVEKTALDALKDYVSPRPRVGVVGSTVVFANQPQIVQCAGGCTYNKWTTVFRPILQGTPLPEVLASSTAFDMDYVYGASMFVRNSVLKCCGGFNEDYFLYYEEIDLCDRVTRAEFELGWCKKSVVKHKGARSLEVISKDERKQRMFGNYHENLSTLIYARKCHAHALLPAMLMRFFGKLLTLSVRGEWYLLHPLWLAYGDFLRGQNRRDSFG